MGLLLDTQVLVWWLVNSPRLGPAARAAIAAPTSAVYVSAVSAWEIAIKARLGKLRAPPDVASWLPAELQRNRIVSLPITLDHAASVEVLPPHHRDPFDRLLIAQATLESLLIVTADATFARYGVPLIKA